MLVTWLVTNNQILSPTHLVSNIRHQHRTSVTNIGAPSASCGRFSFLELLKQLAQVKSNLLWETITFKKIGHQKVLVWPALRNLKSYHLKHIIYPVHDRIIHFKVSLIIWELELVILSEKVRKIHWAEDKRFIWFEKILNKSRTDSEQLNLM